MTQRPVRRWMVVLAFGVRFARAEDARARLSFEARDPQGVCPSESVFRGKIVTRLGYDPFREGATTLLSIRISAAQGKAHALVAFGSGERRRELVDSNCAELVDAVASTVAIALDPFAASKGPEERNRNAGEDPQRNSNTTGAGQSSKGLLTEPHEGNVDRSRTSSSVAPSPVVVSPVEPVQPQAPHDVASSSRERAHPFVTLDGVVGIGRLTDVSFGARLGFGLRYGWFRAVLEGSADLAPGSQLSPIDRVDSTLYAGSIAACGVISVLSFCGVGSFGSFQATALDVTRPSPRAIFYPSVSARVTAAVPIGPSFRLRASAEAGVPVVRATFFIDNAPVWTSPPVFGLFALGAGWEFR